ncbi:MAG: hypothetical protein R3263_06845, partial [Myxococcota bacterium]|nr:hypothetical protein [Myxococcota bacterium]
MAAILAALVSGALLAAAERAPLPCLLVGLAPLLGVATGCPAPRRAAVAGVGLLSGALLYGSQLRGLLAVPWGPAPWVVLGIVALLALGVAGFAVAVAEVGRRRGPGTGLAFAPALWVALEGVAGRPPFEIAWLDLGAL